MTTTTTADGVHDHPSMKLGLKPHGKSDGQLLALRWKAVPPFEPRVDRFAGVTLGLDANDQYGDCGPTSCDNHYRVTSRVLGGVEVDATLDQVFALYRASGNPGFDPATGADDNGVDMATMLSAVRKVGLAGKRILAFGRLTDTSDESIYAAISLFGAVLFAVDLQTAQQNQPTTWDYKKSSAWGGHAIVAGAYDSSRGTVDVFTWGDRVTTTAAFRSHQLSEVWVPLWPEVVQSDKFVTSVDVPTLAAAFHQLTGEQWPAAVNPPAPTPGPSPLPSPASDADKVLAQAAQDWVMNHRHTGEAGQVATALRAWLAAKGFIGIHALGSDE